MTSQSHLVQSKIRLSIATNRASDRSIKTTGSSACVQRQYLTVHRPIIKNFQNLKPIPDSKLFFAIDESDLSCTCRTFSSDGNVSHKQVKKRLRRQNVDDSRLGMVPERDEKPLFYILQEDLTPLINPKKILESTQWSDLQQRKDDIATTNQIRRLFYHHISRANGLSDRQMSAICDYLTQQILKPGTLESRLALVALKEIVEALPRTINSSYKTLCRALMNRLVTQSDAMSLDVKVALYSLAKHVKPKEQFLTVLITCGNTHWSPRVRCLTAKLVIHMVDAIGVSKVLAARKMAKKVLDLVLVSVQDDSREIRHHGKILIQMLTKRKEFQYTVKSLYRGADLLVVQNAVEDVEKATLEGDFGKRFFDKNYK